MLLVFQPLLDLVLHPHFDSNSNPNRQNQALQLVLHANICQIDFCLNITFCDGKVRNLVANSAEYCQLFE